MVTSLAYIMVYCLSVPISFWTLACGRLLYLCMFLHINQILFVESTSTNIFIYIFSLMQHLQPCASGSGCHIM